MARRLAGLASQVRAFQSAVYAQPTGPSQGVGPAATGHSGSAGHAPLPSRPVSMGHPASPGWTAPVGHPYPRHPGAPPPRRPSALQRLAASTDGRTVGVTLSALGMLVALVGVVLLLVLAARAGILGPPARVSAGAALAFATVAAGVRSRGRGFHVGSVAMVATGVTAGLLDVVAVTRIYHWLPTPAGLAAVGVVFLCGLIVARVWSSEHLAVVVAVAATLSSPFVAGGVDLPLVGVMSTVSALAFATTVDLEWPRFHVVRVAVGVVWLVPTIVVLGAGLSGAGLTGAGLMVDGVRQALLVAAGVGSALIGILATGAITRRQVHGVVAASTSVIGSAPMLILGVVVSRSVAATALFAEAVGLLVVVVAHRTARDAATIRSVWCVLASVCGLIGVALVFSGPVLAPAVAAMACAVAALGRNGVGTSLRRGGAVVRGIGLGYTAVAAVIFVAWTPPTSIAIATPMSAAITVSLVVTGLLLSTAAVLSVLSSSRSRGDRPQRVGPWVGVGAVVLYAFTASCVATGVAAGGLTHGFRAGHLAATIGWAIAAAALLSIASRRPPGSGRAVWLGGGLMLAGGGVAKLFMFDLAALDGAWRIAAFIGVGLLLLAVGARYARTATAPAPAAPSPPASEAHTPARHP